MSQGDWLLFLEEVDVNKDGNISIHEFNEFLEKIIVR